MIVLDNLVLGFNRYKIVSPIVSGHIKKGSMLAIVGPNGIGKSTLLKTLAGLLPPISGRLKFKIPVSASSISYLPQIKTLDYNYPLTVFEVVSMGCWPKISLFAKINCYQQMMICRVLKKVKLLNLQHRYIEDLSGGQFQCMLFARMLVQKASLILLDEPFQGIDISMRHMMLRLVSHLCNNGCTVIIVLHDDALINKYFSSVLMLTNSCSIWKVL